MSEIINLLDALEYKEDSISHKTLNEKKGGSLTLYAFDKAQGLGKHSAPHSSSIQIIEGKAEITIDEENHLIGEGQMVTIPADIPFSLHAIHKVKAIVFRIQLSVES